MKIAVIGNGGGGGKSTLRRRMGHRFGIQHRELRGRPERSVTAPARVEKLVHVRHASSDSSQSRHTFTRKDIFRATPRAVRLTPEQGAGRARRSTRARVYLY